MKHINEILFGLLREFDLPEPEIQFELRQEGREITLLLAFPEQQIGIREGGALEVVQYGEWRVWECHTEERARVICREVANAMGIQPSVLRLDFSRIDALLGANQFDAAREALEDLQKTIQQDHPDYQKCESLRATIRHAKRKSQGGAPDTRPPEIPRASFPQLLKNDAERVGIPNVQGIHILGFYSPHNESYKNVDAVWIATPGEGTTELWEGCLEGSSAYEADPSWQTFGTEIELLDLILERLRNRLVLTWHADDALRMLSSLHQRVKGVPIANEDVALFDLQHIVQVAFPRAHRTDFPESLCKQLAIPFQDDMGNGGPLAAMTALIFATKEKLGGTGDVLLSALRSVLSFKVAAPQPDPTNKQSSAAAPRDLVLSQEVLDIFLPCSPSLGFEEYLQAVEKHFKGLERLVQSSLGTRELHAFGVSDFLRKGGFLEQAATFQYKERADQIGFSQRAEESFGDGRPYVIEAGTGIGKTIGYLVPALLSGKKALASTHTKALQDQAWSKDVPLVLSAMSIAGIQRSVAIIKGKSNYICLQTLDDWLEEPREFIHTSNDAFFLASLMNWLLSTQTGWLSEIEHLGSWQLLQSLGRDEAPPKLRDRWTAIDPHSLAKEAAADADLVLVNHSYVFSLANADESSTDKFEILILDEAHNVEGVVTEVLTEDFRPWALRNELKSLLKRDAKDQPQGLFRAILRHPQIDSQPRVKAVSTALEKVENGIEQWCARAQRRLDEITAGAGEADPELPVPFHARDFWIDPLYRSAQELHQNIGTLAATIHLLLDELPSIKGLPKRISGSLMALEAHLNENFDALNSLFESQEDIVHWGEAQCFFQDGENLWTVELHCTPLDISTWLRERIEPRYPHRLYVSATLSVGGDFALICERLGLTTDVDEKKPVTGIYPSPYDFKRQSLLAVPHDIPRPNPTLRIDPLYLEQQSNHISDLASISEGRMLVLFTSRLTMRQMHARVQDRLSLKGITVLSQEDANRSALIDRFREAPRKGEKIVLLGLRAFWEGIDIPGEALSVLIISRLPFDFHGHPVAQAREMFYRRAHHDADYFSQRIIPQVFLYLRQMYGRLIRTETDRGVTVITDPRIYTQRYGRYLLERLPETTTIVDKGGTVVETVQRFLAGEEVTSSFVRSQLPAVETDLSPEQNAIVTSPSKRILVRAAAGSGKTHVLISRMVRLIESGMAKPEEVLALTFTNKAMNVMYGRLEHILGGQRAYPMHRNILTYHRLAMRIKRQDDLNANAQTGFIDEKDPELQNRIFEEARRVAGLTENILNNDDARTMVSFAQNGLVNEDDLQNHIPEWEGSDTLLAQLAKFYLSYSKILRDRSLVDYGEAIVSAVRILRENKEQAQRWANRFKWIFCDEYQDTSPAQATLFQLIAQNANLFVVGDNAQSIYSWQGSDPNNLRQFELDFPNTATYNLSKNYRCFPRLVRLSSQFLERTGQSHGLRVEYDQKRSTEEQSVFFLHNENDDHEGKAIAELAKQALDLEIPGDPPPKATLGILARKWQLLEAVEKQLIRNGIPYKFEGETARGIVASQRVRDLVKRAADILGRSQLETEFGDTDDGRIADCLKRNDISLANQLLKAVYEAMPGDELSGSDLADFNRLCGIVKDLPPSVLGKLFGVEETDSCVVLSTVHSQKGEEFDTVIVIGLEQGNSPHEHPPAHERLVAWRKVVQSLSRATWRAPLADRDLQLLYEQEEKRIFYVAMTRARYNLVVSRAAERVLFGRQRQFRKSDFLSIAHDPKLVKETSHSYDLTLAVPLRHIASTDGYRTDDRVFQTNSGVFVRSKSEMLLANEFTSRGMLYEYEEPDPNIPGALPDFRFPDYGDVILEHLGLLIDAEYLEKWERKAREYESKGVRYFRTNEEEIRTLPATVDRLRAQFRIWTQQHYGTRRIEMVDILEDIRCSMDIWVGRPLGEFSDEIYEARSSSTPSVLAVGLGDESRTLNMISNKPVRWEAMDVRSHRVYLAHVGGAYEFGSEG